MKTVFLLLFLFVVLSCGRNSSNDATPQDVLPAATTSGANTAGCLVNGKVLIPKNGSQSIGGQPLYGLLSSVGPNFNFPPVGNDTWDLLITNHSTKNSLSINLENLSQGIGEYQLNSSNTIAYKDGSGNYFTSSNNSGIVKITRFDYLLGIYSGQFSSSLKNSNTGEIIEIKEGRFDINYTTLNH
ncbi:MULTISPECIES: DUF6252 family protein [Chryseobacterium]|uniref:Lipoprotein n=1 Tax=Chryseobacterium koreense CCUG 49689 TaxID=1304281 RepID=A0A0J7J1M6_9FLAO|nr:MULTISPECIES: DUF6252 family protein [Chryseobacterium]KMQ71961.1 hypothetical protein ACM44_02760 [Chryseobacterium koreense CCUG 49689]MBB5332174.1 hypothetical protein [Chryseobacterium koreense]